MRIIITTNGKEVVNKLYTSKSSSDLFNNLKGPSNSRNNNLTSSLNNLNNNINQQNRENNSITLDESKLPQHTNNNSKLLSNNINLIHPKLIKIKEPNIQIPKILLIKYNESLNTEDKLKSQIVTQSQNILSALDTNSDNRNLINRFTSSNNNIIEDSNTYSRLYSGRSGSTGNMLPIIKSRYSIGEIINKNCFDKLKRKIEERIEENKYDVKIDDKMFRKYVNPKKIFDEIKRERNKSIDASNNKLIEYLMKKTSISDNFLKKINECSDRKLNHLNRIAGKILIDKEIENNYNKKRKERFENRKIKEIMDYRKILVQIKNKVKNNIKDNHMNKYSLLKDKNKIVYKNVFNDFRRKYWQKSDNFARFFPEAQRVHYEEE